MQSNRSLLLWVTNQMHPRGRWICVSTETSACFEERGAGWAPLCFLLLSLPGLLVWVSTSAYCGKFSDRLRDYPDQRNHIIVLDG